jgi:hypothetical protein
VHEQLTVPSFATALTNGHGDPEAMPGEAPATGIGGPTIVQSVRLPAPDGRDLGGDSGGAL